MDLFYYGVMSSVTRVFYMLLIIVCFWIFIDAIKRGEGKFKALLWAVGSYFLFFIVIPVWIWKRPNFYVKSKSFCPKCHETYKGKPVCCPHCGYMFSEEVVELSTSELEGELEGDDYRKLSE